MLRASLIAFLVLGQGVSSLAGRVTLCLHTDGGFCVELPGVDCCDHHQVATVEDDCCGATAERSAGAPAAGLGASSCDCTHVALLNQPQVTIKVGGDREPANGQHLFPPPALGHWQPAALAGAHRAPIAFQRTGNNVWGALSFLAPVMLRC